MSAMMEPPPPTPEQLAAWAEAQAEAEREMAAADAAAAARTASTPSAAGTSRRGLRLPKAFLFSLPFLLGIGGAITSTLLLPRPVTPSASAQVTNPAPEATGDIGSIDTLIRAGAFAEALALCNRERNARPEARAYREAVCLEALGRLKQAAEAYRRAEPNENDQAAWARALLGQARCAAAAGDLGSAQVYLDRVYLRSGHPDCAGTHILDECLFLRARFNALRLGSVRALDPFDPEAIAWPALSGVLDKYYEWLPPDTIPAGSVGPAAPNAIAAHRDAKAAGGFVVTAHLAERPLPNLLQAISTAAGLKLHLDKTISTALEKEVTAVDVESMPIEELLVSLTGRFGVQWKLESTNLTASLAPTASGDRALVVRSFQRAIAGAPEHPLILSARIYLGNYEFLAGHTREAAKEYQLVLDTAQEASQVPHALYNIGLAELRLNELPAARSRFVSLADRAPRTRWADYGWWWVGRTHLDSGDESAAKKAFRSALSGRTREVTSAAAIGTCACDVLEGNDESAKKVLGEFRIDSREMHADLAKMFESLFRYRSTPTKGRREILLDTLHHTSNARGLGPCGLFLAGQVYRTLDLPERTAALYDAATETTRGPLAVRMTFDAAQWYDLLDRFEPARQRYLAVAAADAKGLGSQAEFRLAGMAYRQRHADECIRRCRTLLDRPGMDRAEVLGLMGRAYELQRNYRLAADCFAGRVPVE